MAARIGNFRELIVYQKAFELQCEIYKMTRPLPKEETYGLITQIRNSSRSVGANIAEAWQKRRYQAHFVSKLTDSDGEFAETQHWLDTALHCEYIDSDRHKEMSGYANEVVRMLGSMMAKPEQWCVKAAE